MSQDRKRSTKPSSNVVGIAPRPGEAPARSIARGMLDPATPAAGTLNRIYRGAAEQGDVNGYIAELQHLAHAASTGDLSRSEAMLTTQAHTLDGLFHMLTGWALNQVGENGSPALFETCMRLAFKAQSQCRATNETLAEIKNPPNVAFVKAGQANIAQALQVNNGVQASGARENDIPPSKLSGAQHGGRLDTGAARAQSRNDKELGPWECSTGSEDCAR